jgi:hypothetical protein
MGHRRTGLSDYRLAPDLPVFAYHGRLRWIVSRAEMVSDPKPCRGCEVLYRWSGSESGYCNPKRRAGAGGARFEVSAVLGHGPRTFRNASILLH